MTYTDCTLRPEQDADSPFIEHLYASTRAAEMSSCGWPADTIAAFLRHQCRLQSHYYREQFPDAEFWIVERYGAAIGRLYLSWGEASLQLIDIALVPEHRGVGIGSALLGMLLRRADDQKLAVDLHVEVHNQARQLYRRLGFDTVGSNGLYLRMQRAPAPEDGYSPRESVIGTATGQGHRRGAR